MIEQITGTGSSGIADKGGKSGKQGPVGLFTKLMTKLGNGKAVESDSPLTQGKAQSFTPKQNIALAKQAAAEKGVLTEAGKTGISDKKESKKTASLDGSTVQAVAIHVLAQQVETKPKTAALNINTGEKTTQTTDKENKISGKEQQNQFGSSKDGFTTNQQDGKQSNKLTTGKDGQQTFAATKGETPTVVAQPKEANANVAAQPKEANANVAAQPKEANANVAAQP
ncbi:MAG: hypothetical protein Q9M31_03655, partial [Mariprofundus sp.]|nr:hypothetical protein [Mariprofundus sp.]